MAVGAADSCCVESAPGGVLKSVSDRRNYRVVRLENGLRCLLISDPCWEGTDAAEPGEPHQEEPGQPQEQMEGEEEGGEEDDAPQGSDIQAAAAMCVNVGSFLDPKAIGGLAHFLEHMLFMGSELYPSENEFDQFLSKHSGYSNAATEYEQTVFAFEVHKDQFYEALDRFSQFFISPLMLEDCMTRELQAVDNEFVMSQQSDTTRRGQIMCHLAKETHPLNGFAWGNTQSLKTNPETQGTDVRRTLREFFDAHYTAPAMALCVLTYDSLDTIETHIRECFSSVKGAEVGPPTFAHCGDPFGHTFKGKHVKVIPVLNNHLLELSWILPPMFDKYRAKPWTYLSELIGHEGSGSLFSELKTRGWATALGAGNGGGSQECNSSFFAFTVSMALTDQGLASLFEVVALVVEYLAMLRTTGPQEWLFREFQAIADAQVRFQESGDAYDMVEQLVMDMVHFPDRDILVGDQLFFEYDPEGIRALVDLFVVDNMIMTSSSQTYELRDADTEPWFGASYAVQDVPAEHLSRWSALEAAGKWDAKRFHLPPPNDLIATDFTLFPSEPSQLDNEPTLLQSTTQGNLWFQRDTVFKLPKAFIDLMIVTPAVDESPATRVLINLLLRILQLQLKEHTYNAEVAHMSFSFNSSHRGIEIRVTGYNEKVPKLIGVLIKGLASFEGNEDLFNVCKERLLKSLSNQLLNPDALARQSRFKALFTSRWTPQELLAVAPSVDMAAVKSFAAAILREHFVDCFVYGNVQEATAKAVMANALEHLRGATLPGPKHPTKLIREVPLGSMAIQLANANQEDNNTIVANYYQIGERDAQDLAHIQLLESIMSEPLFQQLRTESQLGYAVSCEYLLTHGHLGYRVYVNTQASRFSAAEVDERVELFLTEFLAFLQDMTDDFFATSMASLVEEKRKPDVNMGGTFERHLSAIQSRDYAFHRLEKEAAEISLRTKEGLIAWYTKHLLPGSPHRRKISFRVIAVSSVSGDEREELIAPEAGPAELLRLCGGFPVLPAVEDVLARLKLDP